MSNSKNSEGLQLKCNSMLNVITNASGKKMVIFILISILFVSLPVIVSFKEGTWNGKMGLNLSSDYGYFVIYYAGYLTTIILIRTFYKEFLKVFGKLVDLFMKRSTDESISVLMKKVNSYFNNKIKIALPIALSIICSYVCYVYYFLSEEKRWINYPDLFPSTNFINITVTGILGFFVNLIFYYLICEVLALVVSIFMSFWELISSHEKVNSICDIEMIDTTLFKKMMRIISNAIFIYASIFIIYVVMGYDFGNLIFYSNVYWITLAAFIFFCLVMYFLPTLPIVILNNKVKDRMLGDITKKINSINKNIMIKIEAGEEISKDIETLEVYRDYYNGTKRNMYKKLILDNLIRFFRSISPIIFNILLVEVIKAVY